MNKQTMAYLYNDILSNKKKQNTDTDNVDGFQKHAKRKKPDAKDYIL